MFKPNELKAMTCIYFQSGAGCKCKENKLKIGFCHLHNHDTRCTIFELNKENKK